MGLDEITEETFDDGEEADDQFLEKWTADRLSSQSQKVEVAAGQSLFLPMKQMKNYEAANGIKVQINSAHGIDSKELYTNIHAFVHEGTQAGDPATREMKAKKCGKSQFVTNSRDYNSLLGSPKWTDDAVTIRPGLNKLSKLVLSVLGVVDLDLQSEMEGEMNIVSAAPRRREVQKENVTPSTSGQPLTFLGWTAVDLFDTGSEAFQFRICFFVIWCRFRLFCELWCSLSAFDRCSKSDQ